MGIDHTANLQNIQNFEDFQVPTVFSKKETRWRTTWNQLLRELGEEPDHEIIRALYEMLATAKVNLNRMGKQLIKDSGIEET